jgi:hypothetical protein
VKPELILPIATVILAIATAWMAWETRRTAKAATRTLELEKMPVLGVRAFKFDFDRAASPQQPCFGSIRIAIELFNAGRVPVRYKVKSCSVAFANQEISGQPQFRSHVGKVLPSASRIFFHPGLSLNPPVSTFPATGRIRFEYEYSDESDRQPHSIVEKIEYTVYAAAVGLARVTWHNIE